MSLETGADTWHTTVELADDNDSRDAASTNIALEALLDRTFYLHRRIVTGIGTVVVEAVHLTDPYEAVRHVPMNPIFDPAGWALEASTLSSPPLRSVWIASAATEWIMLPLSAVMTLAGYLIEANVKCAAGAGSTMSGTPANRMQVGVFYQDMANTDATNQYVQVDTLTNDSSADSTAYSAPHIIRAEFPSVVLVAGRAYYLGLRSDTSSKGKLYQATVTYSAFNILPGGA